ncbi:ParB/RepB/Spo0J family partition protein [Arthrobacter sp. H5]|uniref:ParB/RepB/Spo0J family partition protein n=1 Tax=Arthrobacter sp. H5 TaxID=1267973 RepID=UPI0004809C70|nr:ParB/RepB/Spo0J family partition protein [Arthrobacter sp. H5]
MAEKRRGLGRGLGALIPSAPDNDAAVDPAVEKPSVGRPVDLFFPSAPGSAKASRQSTPSGAGDRDPGVINKEALKGPAKRTGGRSAKPSGVRKTAARPDSSEIVEPGVADRPSVDPNQLDRAQDAPAVVKPEDQDLASAAEDLEVSRETLTPVPGAQFAEIPVMSVHPNRRQPRTVFDEDEMAELVHSIREIGVLQPIVVRLSQEQGDQPYELVMGERRWRASRDAGLDTVPAIIRSTTDDALLRDALLENLHRSQLNPLEEAAAYQQLLDDFGCSQEELATRIGRSRPQISNTLRLMKLPPLVQRRLAAGVLSAGHARALLGLGDQAEMEKLAQRIVAEGLSVRSTEEIVAMSDGLRRPAKPSTPRAGARHERLDYLATSLSDHLDTSVKITLGAKKGKVSIEFASVDDLNRIMSVLNPANE